ncbi:hypothetical protein [Rhizorhabdus phycosphaerae]|nr:hypothetical protein [Rhizorhabdus phycosphaerae]
MSDETPMDQELTLKGAIWTAPELTVIDLSEATETFNGGAGDSNTGS